jgi:hypothetical protein
MTSSSDDLLDDLIEDEAETTQSKASKKSDAEVEAAYQNISFRVIYQANNFFLPQIRDLINGREVINLRPEYQRRLRWSPKKKSLLIESLLLNIPIPPIFLFESDLARYEVMDGQQRLNAIHDYLENGFSLVGLERLDFLNGRRYKSLPPKLIRGLERSSLSAIVLLQETKSDKSDPFVVRRHVFERLNTGGEKLNPQEIRNSIYRGNFNNLTVRLARNEQFCRIFGIPLYTETDENEYYENPDRQKNTLYKRMNDCQLVLRFFALQDDSNIRGSMHSILENCMRRNSDRSQIDLDKDALDFERAIRVCHDLFDGQPFLLPADEKGHRRISVALYDALMVAFYRRADSNAAVLAKAKVIRKEIDSAVAMNTALFTGKANTSQSIKDRIQSIVKILDQTL